MKCGHTRVLMAAAGLAVWLGAPGMALGQETVLQASNARYEVHLGVVPASRIRREPDLLGDDPGAHGGAGAQPASGKHVLVSVFRIPGHERLVDAQAIARVEGDRVQEKPLEPMAGIAPVTYGNYFYMPAGRTYRIEVRIRDEGKQEGDTFVFSYREQL